MMPPQEIESQNYWDRHAASDPLWAVLSFPEKSDGRWTLREFMRNGEREVALLFQQFTQLGVVVPTRRALDFGCGVGRLTQAFARRMTDAVGVDISPVMIETARRLNHYPERARYLCTAITPLEQLPSRSFECIYTNMVLQHIAPDLSVHYLDEFFRLLEPHGELVFQLPSHKEPRAQPEINPMPHEAYSAAITLTERAPSSVAAGFEFALALTVRNTSAFEWRQAQSGPLAVGNHWLDATGDLMLVQDDGRAPALQIVSPGFEWPLLLPVRAPAEPGRYVIEVDLVHEGIAWYRDKGSSTLRVPIEVVRDTTVADGPSAAMIKEFAIPEYSETAVPRPSRGAKPSTVVEFPMYGVPRDHVMAIIGRHGGRLVHLEEDRRAGPEWVSYRYFVLAQ
jgi:SAM-dependent methyltransferase